MDKANILIIGGGIGGLTAAIALRRHGFAVEVIEKDPDWSVYGVGIIQQANVIRAIADLGILDTYLAAGVSFDAVEIFAPNGVRVASVPSPRLAEGYPPCAGIGRPALHRVLGNAVLEAGATVRLGITAERMTDDGAAVHVRFSDGGEGCYDIVIGADGVYSQTRQMIFPDAQKPEFTGQGVWRYNFARPADMNRLQVFNGPVSTGLMPFSQELMYMFVTTPEPGNPRYPREGLAEEMRGRLAGCAPYIQELASGITDDAAVVYRPLEALLIEGPWHKGRVVLLGDAVHATTPHLGQGAGMAIEDSLVLAEELARHDDAGTAFAAYRDRRFDRCAYIVRSSLAICKGQLGEGPEVDPAQATAEMFAVIAQPI